MKRGFHHINAHTANKTFVKCRQTDVRMTIYMQISPYYTKLDYKYGGTENDYQT